MKKFKIMIIYITALILSFVSIVSVLMAIKNTNELTNILEESIKSQLISIALAAREFVDSDALIEYNSAVATSSKEYIKTNIQLRRLARDVHVDYIYVLRYIDGKCVFIFDSDAVDNAAFEEYTLSDVHKSAFKGIESAGVMNVEDEWGSFNSACVPIYNESGEVVAIVCADIRDTYFVESQNTARFNTVVLVAFLIIMMSVMFVIIYFLTARLNKLQTSLEKMALFDMVTGLPNRQHLFDYLAEITKKGSNESYAVLFIDLDNFKRVNDAAGHDAGDELLKHISSFLESFGKNAVSFRPVAGRLNISARVGGDEFIQIVAGVETEEQAEELGKQLIDEFVANVNSRLAQKYSVGLSVGIALYPYHSEDFNVLIKYSDIAMYHAKENGKNRSVVYHDEMSSK